MEIHIYSVKGKNQGGNDNTKKTKATRHSARDLKNLYILPKNSAEGLGSRRERW